MKRFQDPAQALAGYLAKSLGYDEERRSVMAYGLGALFQMLLLLVCSLIFGLLADCLPEAMILFWGVGLLRRSTGGVHSSTYLGCVCVSLTSICGLAALCRYAVPVTAHWAVYALAGIVPAFGCLTAVAWKKAPRGTANKPIDRPEKIARLRRQCFLTIALYGVVAAALLISAQSRPRLIGAMSAMVAVAWWSALMLTDFSAGWMERINRVLVSR